MNQPKLKYPRLCRILTYVVVISAAILPIILVFHFKSGNFPFIFLCCCQRMCTGTTFTLGYFFCLHITLSAIMSVRPIQHLFLIQSEFTGYNTQTFSFLTHGQDFRFNIFDFRVFFLT